MNRPMSDSNIKRIRENKLTLAGRLTRFTFGLIVLAGLVLFFASGYSPPGVMGEVLRHNQEYQIDASPFFYGDVENMSEYEEGVRLMRLKAEIKSRFERN